MIILYNIILIVVVNVAFIFLGKRFFIYFMVFVGIQWKQMCNQRLFVGILVRMGFIGKYIFVIVIQKSLSLFLRFENVWISRYWGRRFTFGVVRAEFIGCFVFVQAAFLEFKFLQVYLKVIYKYRMSVNYVIRRYFLEFILDIIKRQRRRKWYFYSFKVKNRYREGLSFIQFYVWFFVNELKRYVDRYRLALRFYVRIIIRKIYIYV